MENITDNFTLVNLSGTIWSASYSIGDGDVLTISDSKVKVSRQQKEETPISRFSQYAEIDMELPQTIEPNKVTTGVVYNEDGTFAPVPTEVYKKDGKCFAKIRTLGDGTYTVISHNPVPSVENHWAKEAVNDLASRFIIKNPESFAPNAPITIAADYGIIKGYEDNTFRPNGKITREEAMTMYKRAMDLIDLEIEETHNQIETYQDKDQIAPRAYETVKAVVEAGVFNGKTINTIDPKGTFTYSEAATAIRNLLIKGQTH